MYTYRPKGNKIYHYSICSFKGMNLREARKEYIKMKNSNKPIMLRTWKKIKPVKLDLENYYFGTMYYTI